jgi:hypothetical protein
VGICTTLCTAKEWRCVVLPFSCACVVSGSRCYPRDGTTVSCEDACVRWRGAARRHHQFPLGTFAPLRRRLVRWLAHRPWEAEGSKKRKMARVLEVQLFLVLSPRDWRPTLRSWSTAGSALSLSWADEEEVARKGFPGLGPSLGLIKMQQMSLIKMLFFLSFLFFCWYKCIKF